MVRGSRPPIRLSHTFRPHTTCRSPDRDRSDTARPPPARRPSSRGMRATRTTIRPPGSRGPQPRARFRRPRARRRSWTSRTGGGKPEMSDGSTPSLVALRGLTSAEGARWSRCARDDREKRSPPAPPADAGRGSREGPGRSAAGGVAAGAAAGSSPRPRTARGGGRPRSGASRRFGAEKRRSRAIVVASRSGDSAAGPKRESCAGRGRSGCAVKVNPITGRAGRPRLELEPR